MVESYKHRYAVFGTLCAVFYCALLLGIHYLVSSGTPAQMLHDFPAAAIMLFLTLPIFFLIGYLWGSDKDKGESLKSLGARQREHDGVADNLAALLREGAETRRMSGIAVQEMKHPLTSIVGYSLTLCDYWDGLDESSRRECVDIIRVSASRLEGIANSLLRITESARLSARLEEKPVDLRELASEVKQILEGIYSERGVRIGLRSPEDLPLLKGDPSRLFDMLYNLLDICMRCSESQKIVSAWFSCREKEVQLRLRCPHSSIASDHLLQLKEWPPAEDEGEEATLSMEYRLAQHLVEEVGGKLRIDPLGDRGISFLVSLPAP